ncbi:MAG: hypothetical protein QOJ98_3291 [Acidobacteriota bacterium]|jgi:hypothetical protein|nr:hypothetical protein [Acidobacteriota bacterium]
MKKFVPAFFVLLLLTVSSEAQTRWGVRAGIVDDDPMIGGEVIVPLPAGFVLNPNIEFTKDLFTANADVHYDFTLTAQTDFWLGAGLAFVNPDEGDYDGGLNVLAGVGVRRGSWYPYGQVKMTTGGDIDEFFSAAVGVRF